LAEVRLRPRPPAAVEMRKRKSESHVLKSSTSCWRSSRLVLPSSLTKLCVFMAHHDVINTLRIQTAGIV
jgi:hypothetical protein